MKVYLAGQHTYPSLIAETLCGGSGQDFLSGKSNQTIISKWLRDENISSRRKWQGQNNTRLEGGQDQINAYLGVKSENFWRGGNQGTGFMMTWFRL